MLRNKSAACLRNIKFPVKNYRSLRVSFGMGCICSKGSTDEDTVKKGSKKSSNSSKDEPAADNEATTRVENSDKKSTGREEGDSKPQMCRVLSVRNGLDGAQVVAGWPSWLTSVAGEAIKGWIPRRADSFEKLDKIGQGTYSSVYRALDLETGKVVALKKVRFVNMDPESVRFMAREILILRRLDHPNVMKLEGLVTSRVSGNLYLVFEYMDHDLAGLRASPAVQFTESQIKCFMLQLFRGLEHCHNRGVLHRDIKGSNLLIDYHGNLKIGDFGLATFFRAKQRQPLTSRVVTLWYRPPELLLGATDYGVAVDLWSSGCILAELFVGKPIMPGRTEVEQLHKIFKLCGSPSEEYWKNSKLSHSTIFKPQQPYKRSVAETFKDFPPSSLSLLESLLAFEPELRGSTASAIQSEFFATNPLPCDPSSLPKYAPSKEYDVKEARRKGGGVDSTRKNSKGSKAIPTPDSNAEPPASTQKWKLQSNPKIESSRAPVGPSGNSHSVLHSSVHRDFKTQRSFKQQATAARLSRFSNSVSGRGDSQLDFSRDSSVHSHWAHHSRRNVQMNDPAESSLGKPVSSYQNTGPSPSVLTENNMSYALKKSRMHYSGPLLPHGGSVDDMLKEHEKQIQIAVRKARDKNTARNAQVGNGKNH